MMCTMFYSSLRPFTVAVFTCSVLAVIACSASVNEQQLNHHPLNQHDDGSRESQLKHPDTILSNQEIQSSVREQPSFQEQQPIAIKEPTPSAMSGQLLSSQAPSAKLDMNDATLSAALGKSLGTFHLTYYWVATESKGHRKQRHQVTLRNRRCKPIAQVSAAFRRTLLREGTGRTQSGKLINVAGTCRCGRCFSLVGERHPYGIGVNDRSLVPFRTVAAPPRIKVGTLLYIAELDGLAVPGLDIIHDGCVIAADRGGGVKAKQLDLFTGGKSRYQRFFDRHRIDRIELSVATHRCEHLRNSDAIAPSPVRSKGRS